MHLNTIISVMLSTLITTVPPAERQAREMIPVPLSSHLEISVLPSRKKSLDHRKRYVKKPDKKADKNDQELDLLGDNSVESFAGSQADLESAADHLFTSPPRPQPLAFEALSFKNSS